MSRVMSFRDLQLIPELSHLREIDMLSIANDQLINSFLSQLGFNTDASVFYEVAKHRDLRNNVGVGFRAVGTITQDRTFLNSRMCSPDERMVAASFTDMSLTRELAKLAGGRSHVELTDNRNLLTGETTELDYTEPDCDDVAAQIKQLEELRDFIRGNPYNEYGSLKTATEYANG